MVILVKPHFGSPAMRSDPLELLRADDSALSDRPPSPSRMWHVPAGLARFWVLVELLRQRGTGMLSFDDWTSTHASARQAAQSCETRKHPAHMHVAAPTPPFTKHSIPVFPETKFCRRIAGPLHPPVRAEAEAVAPRPDDVADPLLLLDEPGIRATG